MAPTTSAKPQQKGLGKGLSALMGDTSPKLENVAARPAANEPQQTLPTSALKAGKYQPRRHFDDAAISELSDSIKKHGLMQPIVVRELKTGSYEIIAGERRFRAARAAGLSQVPVIIKTASDAQALELALIENIQRADLNPLEEAAGYQRLMDEFGYTQEKLAPVVGKSRSHIANLLRLLKLPESIKNRIDSGALTMGHARAILMAKDPEELARQITEIGLSVRQAENIAKGGEPFKPAPSKPSNAFQAPRQAPSGPAKNEDVLQLESMLSNNLGLRVGITARSGQSGDVIISYDTLTQLDEILRRLGGSI